VSLFIGFVLGRVTLANASMLYLIAVLATAVAFGRGPAVFASVVAFLTFDWFFVSPIHQWTVGDAEEWLSLLLFLLTAIVTGQLTTAGGKQGASITVEVGKVVVAFPTIDPLTANGLVNVGDKVDILASVAAGTGDTARATQTTLQNLEVMDILGPTKEQPQRATALVFQVDHQVALVLKYLRDSQATIDLAIRSRSESAIVKTTSVDLGFLTTTYGIRR